MPKHDAQKFLDEANQQAEEYAAKATKLSNLLEKAEQYLQRMPGKIELHIGESDQLRFLRSEGGWRLKYAIFPDDAPADAEPDLVDVTNGSVEIKAMAAQVLPELFQEIEEQRRSRLTEVDKGLEALREIPFLQDEFEEDEK